MTVMQVLWANQIFLLYNPNFLKFSLKSQCKNFPKLANGDVKNILKLANGDVKNIPKLANNDVKNILKLANNGIIVVISTIKRVSHGTTSITKINRLGHKAES